MSGSVTPDNYVIARDGQLKRSRIAQQPHALVGLPGGGTEERALSPEDGARATLGEDDLRRLAELGCLLEEHCGAPAGHRVGDRRRRALRAAVAARDDAVSDALIEAALRFAREQHPHAEHLVRTLDWLDALAPGARRGAAPGRAPARHRARLPRPGVALRLRRDWAFEVYVDYHQGRCARLLTRWLAEHGAEPALIADAVAIVAVHERGGWPDADLVQAADSLSFIETLSPLVLRWIAEGTTSRESGLEKMRAMWDRIQVAEAREQGRELYERVMRELEQA